jgi:hypothetical protein
VSGPLSRVQIVVASAAALLLIGNLYLVSSYVAGQDQKSRLVAQTAGLEQSIQRLQPAGPAAVSAPAGVFPADLPRIELADALLAAASQSGAEVVALRTAPITSEQVGSGSYRVMRTNVRLRADSYQLVSFLNALERMALPSMALDSIETTRSGAIWDVTLDAVVYARGGQ